MIVISDNQIKKFTNKNVNSTDHMVSREEEKILTDLLQRMSHTSGVSVMELVNCPNARSRMQLHE